MQYSYAVQPKPVHGAYQLAPPVSVTRVGTPLVSHSPTGTSAVLSAGPSPMTAMTAPAISISSVAAPGPQATAAYPASTTPIVAQKTPAVTRIAASPSRPRVLRAAAPQPTPTMLASPNYRQATPVAPTRILAAGTAPATAVTKVASPAPLVSPCQILPQSQIVANSTRFTFPSSSITKIAPATSMPVHRASASPDVQMMKLKELHSASFLENIHVNQALPEMKAAAESGLLRREHFLQMYTGILQHYGLPVPAEAVQNAVFDLFDTDHNHSVDVLEVLCGLSILCGGEEDEKIDAVFRAFDENSDGYISLDEMTKFITSMFKVSVTQAVLDKVASLDVPVSSVEDLAMATAMDCFKAGDISFDNRISKDEFKTWLFTPRADPGYIMSPLKKAFV